MKEASSPCSLILIENIFGWNPVRDSGPLHGPTFKSPGSGHKPGGADSPA